MTSLALYYTHKPEDIHGALLEVTTEELKILDNREIDIFVHHLSGILK